VSSAPPTVGRVAPNFTLLTDAGTPLTLKDLRGQRVVLYFYPKDNTTGCTQEACEFRDLFPRFQSSGVHVIGVSPDSVKKHQNFKKKFDLPFTLLADTEHAVAERYGIWVQKMLYGHKYMAVERTTYVLDAKGVIRHIFPKVEIDGHAEAVAAVL
jgi:thioredoxin-dependent peroxiredoxin